MVQSSDEGVARKPFQLLSLATLREYLGLELRVPGCPFPFDIERVLDDFVFMCFFVGNDFLPHMPTLEIKEGAIELMMRVYKQVGRGWGVCGVCGGVCGVWFVLVLVLVAGAGAGGPGGPLGDSARLGLPPPLLHPAPTPRPLPTHPPTPPPTHPPRRSPWPSWAAT
jgi:hypothetical protein